MSKTKPYWPLFRLALLSEIFCFGLLSPSQMPAFAKSHKPGFFVRLSGGPGTGRSTMTFSKDYPDYRVSGSSADLNVVVGAMVFPSIAIHGTAFGWVVAEPDVDFGDYYVEIGKDFKMTALGIGLTYYLMPAEIFASGSLGPAWVSSDKIDTDAGLAFDAFLGKEWSFSHHLWLGIGGGMNYHSIHHGFGPNINPSWDTDWRWKGLSYALRFSLTYR